jgi:hypothetical protein
MDNRILDGADEESSFDNFESNLGVAGCTSTSLHALSVMWFLYSCLSDSIRGDSSEP